MRSALALRAGDNALAEMVAILAGQEAISLHNMGLIAKCSYWRGRAELEVGNFTNAVFSLEEARMCKGRYAEGKDVDHWLAVAATNLPTEHRALPATRERAHSIKTPRTPAARWQTERVLSGTYRMPVSAEPSYLNEMGTRVGLYGSGASTKLPVPVSSRDSTPELDSDGESVTFELDSEGGYKSQRDFANFSRESAAIGDDEEDSPSRDPWPVLTGTTSQKNSFSAGRCFGGGHESEGEPSFEATTLQKRRGHRRGSQQLSIDLNRPVKSIELDTWAEESQGSAFPDKEAYIDFNLWSASVKRQFAAYKRDVAGQLMQLSLTGNPFRSSTKSGRQTSLHLSHPGTTEESPTAKLELGDEGEVEDSETSLVSEISWDNEALGETF